MRRLPELVALVEMGLAKTLPPATEPPGALHGAMRCAILGPGKRLRGALALAAADLVTPDPRPALPAALAVELVHGYSLVHDDLPALDDAAFRRGQPSLHRAFGEPTAILAGDALLTLAFAVLGTASPPDRALRCVGELAHAAGSRGMIGGQQHDTVPSAEQPGYQEISRLKTGRLFVAAARCGGILAGADEPLLGTLEAFAQTLGMAYQLLDDLEDLAEDAAGPRPAPLAGLGPEQARPLALRLLDDAGAWLEELGPRAAALGELLDLVRRRGRGEA